MTDMNLKTIGFVRSEDRNNASGPRGSLMSEHSMVELSCSLNLEDGRHLPYGARGAVVFVHGEGAAYMVEFLTPFHAIATVPADDLLEVSAET